MLDTRGLVALWRFENTALDGSGNGRNGVVTGAAYVNGRLGRALEFAGGVTTDRMTVAHHASLNTTAGLTIAAWIYPHSQGGGNFGRIAQKSQFVALTNGFGYYIVTNKLVLNVNNGVSISATTALAYNTWQHVAVTCDAAGNVLHYRDGAADGGGATDPLANLTNGSDLIIGNRLAPFARSWDGIIDALPLWNRVLIPVDIRRWMHAMSPTA